MASEAFEYSPLSWQANTRVIRLEASLSSSSPLKLRMEEMFVGKEFATRPYSAISYTWGGQTPTCKVLCNGKQLLITANACAALLSQRRRVGDQWLWIDSICIDQECLAEKTKQVEIMLNIFRNAEVVVAWMGKATGHDFSKAWELLAGPNGMAPSPMPEDMASSLEAFHNLEYWNRIWTVQEMMFARKCKVYIGSLRPFSAVSLRGKHLNSEAHFRKRDDTFDVQQEGSAKWLVWAWLTKSATKPHDYIFGLRAVYPRTLGTIPVDYSRETVSIFCEAAWNIMREWGSFLLCFSRHKGKRAGCPSWVPDWSSSQKGEWIQSQWDIEFVNASEKNEVEVPGTWKVSSDLRELSGYGRVVSCVVDTSTSYTHARADCNDCAHATVIGICDEHLEQDVVKWHKACWAYYRTVNVAEYWRFPKYTGNPTKSDATKEADEDAWWATNTNYLYWRSRQSCPRGRDLQLFAQRHEILAADGKIGIGLLESGTCKGDLIVSFGDSRKFALRLIDPQAEAEKFEFLGVITFDEELAEQIRRTSQNHPAEKQHVLAERWFDII